MDTDKLQNIYNVLVEIIKSDKNNNYILSPIEECYVVDGVEFYIPVIGLSAQGIYDLDMFIRSTCKKSNVKWEVCASPMHALLKSGELQSGEEKINEYLNDYLEGKMEFGIYFSIPRKNSVKKYKEIQINPK